MKASTKKSPAQPSVTKEQIANTREFLSEGEYIPEDAPLQPDEMFDDDGNVVDDDD